MDSTDRAASHGSAHKWKFWKRRRHLVTFLAFLGFFNVYTLRVNLSVGIVAMTSPYNVTLQNGTVVQMRDFDWDSKLQGVVLSSFFYGYICTQLLGGWLGARMGGSRVYGVGVAVTAAFTLITPPVVNVSVYLLLAIRIIEGLFEGVTYPCIHAVWSRWAPPQERSRMASIAFSGSFVGTVVALPVSGIIANTLGWPWIFYITGFFGLVWCAVWWTVVKDNPDDDPHISPEELKYIKESLGTTDTSLKHIKHPWKKFLTSMPVWAIVAAHFCENWGFYTLLTQLPTFMKDTLNFQLEKAGFMSSLPYLVMAIIMQFAGTLADWLQNTNILTTTQVRKLFNCGAFISQTIFMFLAGHLLTPAGVTTCLVLAVGLGAFAWPAFSVNHLDIAPQHASVLMGLSNTFATLPGILSPLITGYIVTDKSADQWQMVFYIASTIYLLGALFYGTFASGERQPWALDDSKQSTPPPALKNENHAYVNKALSDDNV
ncbi:vesicular glutamate transporter 1-like [Macrosteles quadrilineatus]|uniref:vesicular glutamate transporter 1-like n=1 Tax=Macrosteles quadrilineatus TaxID=74068 RepID=UPI0023E343FF|nr:vesicular glutamate transporter 1-like [Macrosteles quadrilineatus]XP_054262497.1 vesicular glutamate transporter 1-like [Macrosteles quadrilineatus]XP_054262498.1 vesicular glutamate transporter 1-like [Macrosteles quadrilineatus]